MKHMGFLNSSCLAIGPMHSNIKVYYRSLEVHGLGHLQYNMCAVALLFCYYKQMPK